MSDLEDKLRNLTFRTPPVSLRREILAAAESGRRSSKWREWLWPSPLAWGSLAAIWVFLLCCNAAMRPAPSDLPRGDQHMVHFSPVPFYAIQSHGDLSALLKNPN